MTFTLAQIAAALGLATQAHGSVTGWSIDTRTLKPGDLFFALRGPVHDGNEYIERALAQGAIAVIAERAADGPVLVVRDSLKALGQLAAWARGQWPGDVIGVTGSAGKTSTKDVIAALLSVALRTGKTEGNFNNQFGLPISILRLPADAEVAVLEMGMNHAGEIRDLAAMARPRVAVVTIVGSAHIEFFDSIEGIAEAKRELVEALPPDGVAVLNADDPRVAAFAGAHPGRNVGQGGLGGRRRQGACPTNAGRTASYGLSENADLRVEDAESPTADARLGRNIVRGANPGGTVTYGLSENADFRAEDVEFLREGTRFRVGGIPFETRLQGRHAVRNILAGIATAGLYGIAPEQLREAVANLEPGKMRGERTQHLGIELLNDCYNSSPDAAKSMLDVLRDTPCVRRIAVLGEMLELGQWSVTLHREVGRYAAESGIDVLVAIRGAAKYMASAALRAGLPAGAAYFFEDPAQAGAGLKGLARAGDAILFKGSRGTHVERALQAFLAEAEVNA